MKEINAILASYEGLDQKNRRAALALVVDVEGSSYRRPGARMLVLDDGRWVGGISGGCLEGDALKKAQAAILQEKAALVTYNTLDPDDRQIGIGLGCNGIIRILFLPVRYDDPDNPVAVLRQIAATRQVSLLLTVVGSSGDAVPETGRTFVLTNDAQLLPQELVFLSNAGLPGHLDEALRSGKSSLHAYTHESGRQIRLFVEVIRPTVHLVIHGGAFDTIALARLARSLDWRITLNMPPAKAPKQLWELADQVVDLSTMELPAFDEYTATVVMSHDLKKDTRDLGRMLGSRIPYIGILGPRKRTLNMLENLKANGLSPHLTDGQRLHYPVGLDIGAVNPDEIAIAIIAEIIAFFSGRSGNNLKFREAPIND